MAGHVSRSVKKFLPLVSLSSRRLGSVLGSDEWQRHHLSPTAPGHNTESVAAVQLFQWQRHFTRSIPRRFKPTNSTWSEVNVRNDRSLFTPQPSLTFLLPEQQVKGQINPHLQKSWGRKRAEPRGRSRRERKKGKEKGRIAVLATRASTTHGALSTVLSRHVGVLSSACEHR